MAAPDLKDYCGSTTGYRHGCRCTRCREAHRVSALLHRRVRGVGPPTIRPVLERFWEKVEKTDSCWLWIAAKDGPGYPLFNVDGTTVRAHRWLYERLVGPIPDDLQLDHLCRVRHCVNPAHLEPVTLAENNRRARLTHCLRGHEFTDENTRWQRCCLTCERVRREERRVNG